MDNDILASYRCPLEFVLILDFDDLDDWELGYRMRAIHVAVKYHQRQYRKTGEPYFEHCLATAEKIRTYLKDKESYAASVLHDVLEDCDPLIRDEIYMKIKKQFGEKVAQIDKVLTKIDKKTYFAQIVEGTMIHFEIPFIKLADRLHNLHSISEHHDTAWKERYFKETLGPMQEMFIACREYMPQAHLTEYELRLEEVLTQARMLSHQL